MASQPKGLWGNRWGVEGLGGRLATRRRLGGSAGAPRPCHPCCWPSSSSSRVSNVVEESSPQATWGDCLAGTDPLPCRGPRMEDGGAIGAGWWGGRLGRGPGGAWAGGRAGFWSLWGPVHRALLRAEGPFFPVTAWKVVMLIHLHLHFSTELCNHSSLGRREPQFPGRCQAGQVARGLGHS